MDLQNEGKVIGFMMVPNNNNKKDNKEPKFIKNHRDDIIAILKDKQVIEALKNAIGYPVPDNGRRPMDYNVEEQPKASEEELKRIKEEYESTLSSKDDEIKRINNDLNETNEKLKRKQTEYDKLKEQIKDKYGEFDKISEVYEVYCSLSNDTKTQFERAIDTQSPISFIMSGSETGNLESIWDAVCRSIREWEEKELEVLKKSMDLFFEYNKQVYRSFERLRTETGDEYDYKKHDRMSDSDTGGNIVEVILEGYRNIKTNKIEKRTIVRL